MTLNNEGFAAFAGQRVVITGGLGFIGSNLGHILVKAGAEVAIIDSLDPRSGGHIGNIEGIEESVELISEDICHFNAVADIVRQASHVFHCAAHTSHPYSMRDPHRDIEVNCIGTINVLEAIRRFSPTARLVYVGTSTQIGTMNTMPITEHHPVAPVDIYSANKTAAEYYCRIYSRAYNLSVNIVRLPNVYGPRANINSPDFGFINYFIGLALNDKPLTIYGNGEQLRSVLYIQDAVHAVTLSAQTDLTSQLWFASAYESISVKQIAERIIDACGTGQVIHVEWPEGRELIDVGDIVIDSSKIQDDLGWQPGVSMEKGLRATVSHYRPST